MTVREVSRATGIPSATLGGWFSGRHLPPATQPAQLAAVFTVLGVPDTDLDQWREALHRVRRAGRPRARVSPYLGLESYGVGDAAWFFGREGLVDDLVAAAEALLAGDRSPRVLSLVGASGSGKTSLLNAGLRARLEAAGVLTAGVAPGADPEAALSEAEAGLGGDRRLVVVDQLEEVFDPRVSAEARGAFLRRLAELAERPGTVVALGLRADFYGHASREPDLVPLLRQGQVLVGPMDVAELRRVVVQPAGRAGATVEPELLDLVLRDLAPRGGAPEPSALPLLSHALRATWQRAPSSRLTVTDYLSVGGVAGAVQRSAEEVYASLTPDARAEAHRIFAQLVNLDEEGLVTRRRLRHEDLAEGNETHAAVIEAFVHGRILTTTEDTVQISHEVLLEAWPRLREWISDDRDALRVRRRVSDTAALWDEHGREPEGLLRGSLLTRARRQVERKDHGLTALERDFVLASLDHDAARRRSRHRRRVLLRTLFAGVAVLAVVASALSVYLVRAVDEVGTQRSAAEDARNRALSRQVAIQAEQLREEEPALAMQLALAAYRLAPTVEARSGLLELTATALGSRMLGPEGPMEAVAHPDGSTLATVASDGRIRIWRRSEGAAPALAHTLDAHGGGELYAAAFSPDGATLVAGGADGTVTLVDLADPASPRLQRSLEGPESAVQDLAFSPDGRTLHAATSDPALHRWRMGARGPRALPVRRDFDGSVQAVAESGTGIVATGGADGSVRLWTARGQRLVPVRRLPVAEGSTVRTVAFSPDGRTVAAGSTDQAVRVWQVASGERLSPPLEGFTSWVNGLAFAPDGATLAAAASGGLVQTWDTRTWETTRSMPGPANFTSVTYLPEGEGLLTGALDGVARVVPLSAPRVEGLGDNVWGLSYPDAGDPVYVGVGSGAPAVVPVRHEGGGLRPDEPLRIPAQAGTLDGVVGVSPDGGTVVGGTSEGRAVVWRLGADGEVEESHVVEAASQLIENVDFSADGARFALSSDDGTAAVYATGVSGPPRRIGAADIGGIAMGVALDSTGSLLAVGGADRLVHLWAVSSEGIEELTRLEGFGNYVYAAAFSADGDQLVAGSADGSVRRWDVSDPGSPEPLGTSVRGPDDAVFSVALDARDDLLAAASQDGRVWLWQVDGGEVTLFARLGNLGAGVFQVAHRPGSAAAAASVTAAGADGRVASWVVDPEAAAEAVCRAAGSPISALEWEQYVPGAPYAPPCAA